MQLAQAPVAPSQRPRPRPLPPPRARALRALALAVGWVVLAAPTLAGWQRCSFARVFHAPCPGCGMTRAVLLLLAGDLRGSLHMHPLAVPLLLSGGAFAASTVWTTYVLGAPLVHRSRLGKASLAALALVYVGTFVLWGARWLGYLGGPVAV